MSLAIASADIGTIKLSWTGRLGTPERKSNITVDTTASLSSHIKSAQVSFSSLQRAMSGYFLQNCRSTSLILNFRKSEPALSSAYFSMASEGHRVRVPFVPKRTVTHAFTTFRGMPVI
jgi:hypothetical protein